jgi:group I intron endonuclease
MGCVYAIVNDINDKIYIGQTKRTLKQRWNEYRTHRKDDGTINRAIFKYGREHFYPSEIIQADTQEKLDEWETMLILLMKSSDGEYGYNLSTGGDHPVLTPEICKQRGDRMRGKPRILHVEHTAAFGRPLSEHHKQRLREGWKKNPELAEERRAKLRGDWSRKGTEIRWGKEKGS